jgi:hypothetical protein
MIKIDSLSKRMLETLVTDRFFLKTRLNQCKKIQSLKRNGSNSQQTYSAQTDSCIGRGISFCIMLVERRSTDSINSLKCKLNKKSTHERKLTLHALLTKFNL